MLRRMVIGAIRSTAPVFALSVILMTSTSATAVGPGSPTATAAEETGEISAELDPAAEHGSELHPDSFLERFSWKERVERAQRVVIDNPFGGVRLRFGGYAKELEIAAAIQQLDPSIGLLEVTVEDGGSVVDVSVQRVTKGDNDQRGSGRVDVVVMVPEGVSARAETRDGSIACKGVRGDLQLITSTGDIATRMVKGAIQASTDRGSIRVVLESGVTELPQRFETTTGDITVFTADSADLDVSLATSGAMTTDFSLDVEHRDLEEPSKRATSKVGAGGHVLELLSKRGDLSLRRLLMPKSSAEIGRAPGPEHAADPGQQGVEKPTG